MTNLFKSLMLVIIVFTSKSAFAQCTAPVNPTATYNETLNESTFNWDTVPGATAYRFQLKFPWGTWTPTSAALQQIVTAPPFKYTGLATSFPFEWRVSTICGSTESGFTPTQSYTVPCPATSSVSATNITLTSATINWASYPSYNSNTAAFAVSYRLANSNAAWTLVGNTSAFTMDITGLQAGTTYEYCVTTTCSYFNSNPVIAQFTTVAGCGIPFNLWNSSTTHSANRVTWDAVNGAVNYTLQYKRNTQNNWTSVTVSSTTVLLQSLQQETLYDWRVRANCSNGSGVYSTPYQFHTYSAFCNSYGVNSSEWIDLVSLGTISRASGKDVCGYFNSPQSTNLVIGSTGNTGQLSAGYNPGIVFGEKFAIYIDFNRNSNFSDPGELVLPTLSVSSGGVFNFTIDIPSNITPGLTKMRVVMKRSDVAVSPCNGGTRGEVEDYVVNMVTSGQYPEHNNGPIVEVPADERTDIDGNTISDAESFVVAPNPGHGLFYITQGSSYTGGGYRIMNTMNSMVQSGIIPSETGFAVDLGPEPNGVYFLVVTDRNGKNKVVKLMKI